MNVKQRSGQPEADVVEVEARAIASTLIWADGRGTYRLEGDFDRGQALDLARRFG